MTNERLRSALLDARLSTSELGERVGVDPKTVERWLTSDRLPHRSHRLRVGQLLGKDDQYLWPSATGDLRTQSASQAEFVALHTSRGAIPIETWQQLLAQADESIDLLAIAGSFLHDSIPDFDQALLAKARQGVRTRLLFADPNSGMVRLRSHEEGLKDFLVGRVHLTWQYFRPLLEDEAVIARMHSCTLYNSIYRFDNEVLVNIHTFGLPATRSPVLHLHRIAGGRLFNQYMESYDQVWDSAAPLSPQGVA